MARKARKVPLAIKMGVFQLQQLQKEKKHACFLEANIFLMNFRDLDLALRWEFYLRMRTVISEEHRNPQNERTPILDCSACIIILSEKSVY